MTVEIGRLHRQWIRFHPLLFQDVSHRLTAEVLIPSIRSSPKVRV